jgi:hypothetical protein
MTVQYEQTLADIARTEQTFREALDELAARVAAGQRGRGTDLLLQHCREMANIFTNLVAQLGEGREEQATRVAAAHLAARLVDLERAVTHRGLH